MTVTSKQVFSSNVDSMSYDDETQELTVEWSKGRVSVYSNVPPSVAHEAMNSWSVGGYLHANIKSNYPHRYA